MLLPASLEGVHGAPCDRGTRTLQSACKRLALSLIQNVYIAATSLFYLCMSFMPAWQK